MNIVTYRLDAADEIVFVNDGWVEFANENDGKDYLPPGILGHKIWEFIHDDMTVQLYHEMFAQVRKGRTLRFTFRCDSPATRRHLAMAIKPGKESGEVELEVTPLSIEQRAPQELLRNRPVAHPDQILILCGWCRRVQVAPNEWEEVEVAIGRLGLFDRLESIQVSHGICQDCYDRVFEQLKKNKD